MTFAISVEGLSKRYLIGRQLDQRDTSLRDAITSRAKSLAKGVTRFGAKEPITAGDETEELWALKDVSFNIRPGEVVGILGRNGAGKSTLLKVISRITEPTAGSVKLRGRVASLLEVGTGFHTELTGRENIYLNGAILGMQQAEIAKRFDEIVAFAGTERFLDVPVKRYSSGMYVRLAFAVAAHIEPEILIVDEVLAVGDYEFQQKCLGKMQEVASRDGRAVLLVSHNMAAISSLADRAMVLEGGKLARDGDVSDAIAYYMRKGEGTIYKTEQQTESPHLAYAEVSTSDGGGVHRYGEPLAIQFRIKHDKPMSKACFSFHIINQAQQSVVHGFAEPKNMKFGGHPGETVLVCRLPSPKLNVGTYHLRTYLSEPPGGEWYENLDGICSFQVARFDDAPIWGWRPDACVYQEDLNWSLQDA